MTYIKTVKTTTPPPPKHSSPPWWACAIERQIRKQSFSYWESLGRSLDEELWVREWKTVFHWMKLLEERLITGLYLYPPTNTTAACIAILRFLFCSMHVIIAAERCILPLHGYAVRREKTKHVRAPVHFSNVKLELKLQCASELDRHWFDVCRHVGP